MDHPFDLPAYLARIGLHEPPPADADGLATLQRAHRQAIAFENLDIILGRPIAIDSKAVFAKLVSARRGGYCFEHNRLFLDALAALGIAARPLLARVWLGASIVPPKTHTLSLLTIAGRDWIADCGFGGSYTPPMALEDGAEAQTADGASHRLRRDPEHGWMLERHGRPEHTDGRGAGHEGWLPQYSLTCEPVWAADLALSNHWTSTGPASRFVAAPIVSIVLPRGFATLTGRHYRRTTVAEATSGDLASARAYRVRLSMLFGIDLATEEVEQLGLFPSGEP